MATQAPRSNGDRTWTGRADDCRVSDLAAEVEAGEGTIAPSAVEHRSGVPIYDAETVAEAVAGRPELLDELAEVFLNGAGTLVVRHCVEQAAVEGASEVFWQIIDHQRKSGDGAGDHFAKAGANDRIWNSLEKLAVAAPQAFVEYFASPALAAVCRAWLGPGFQVTAQVNVVNPGGEAQSPHRDYHLGFMTEAEAERFPRHQHLLSPALTLQAGIAHGEVTLDSGPTKLLPHSQKYDAGYLAWRRSDFIDYFEAHAIQLEMATGDAVFFNPALFHAAGTNRTGRPRMVNLLQVGSAMGRTMEVVDRRRVAQAIYPILLNWGGTAAQRAAVIAAAAEGYAFPNDLDTHQPEGRLTPITAAEMMETALAEDWSPEKFSENLP